jgi:hypothetical protein
MNMATARTNENLARYTEYLFDNASERAETRLSSLSALYNAHTIHHLNQRGIDEEWSCLEVGGGGWITSWLCARVGAAGRVVTMDIEQRFLQALSFPNLDVCRQGSPKEPPPTGEFDLVHIRLPLTHPPGRESAIRRLVVALKSSGWIVVEESDEISFLPDLAVNPGVISPRVGHAFQQVVTSAGVDLRHGRSLSQDLRSNGLVNIGAETSVFVWKARSEGTKVLKLSREELREVMGWRLMSPSEFKADINPVDEQDFFTLSQKLWTAWGQLPGAAESKLWGNVGWPAQN